MATECTPRGKGGCEIKLEDRAGRADLKSRCDGHKSPLDRDRLDQRVQIRLLHVTSRFIYCTKRGIRELISLNIDGNAPRLTAIEIDKATVYNTEVLWGNEGHVRCFKALSSFRLALRTTAKVAGRARRCSIRANCQSGELGAGAGLHGAI